MAQKGYLDRDVNILADDVLTPYIRNDEGIVNVIDENKEQIKQILNIGGGGGDYSPFEAGTGPDSAQLKGNTNKSTGYRTFTVGYDCLASGIDSQAMGTQCKATGDRAHAEGYETTASNLASHSEGRSNVASGYISHAEGDWSKATAYCSHVEGYQSEANGYCSHAEGFNCIVNSSTSSFDSGSHVEGYKTNAGVKACHAEGARTSALGHYSHSEGNQTQATGQAAHAEGENTRAAGYSAHAEGTNTEASAYHSHAEGSSTTASGNTSHVEGTGTIAAGNCQHVQGAWNVSDGGEYLHIVGNGTGEESRSNAHTVDWNGNAWYAGDVTSTRSDGTEISLNNVLKDFVEETEVDTGIKWYNGKKIYRIGFSIYDYSAGNNQAQHNRTNMDQVINITAQCKGGLITDLWADQIYLHWRIPQVYTFTSSACVIMYYTKNE